MKNVLIAGGSGLIGRSLTKFLQENDYNVCWLTRKINNKINVKQFEWDVESNKIEKLSLNNIDIVINLSGENIDNKRWNKDFKNKIYNSRVKSVQLLVNTILNNPNNAVKTYINASGIGFYGNTTSEKIYNENDLPGTDFLAITCREAENQSKKLNEVGIKTAIIRTAIVLSSNSKAYKKLSLPVKLGLGTALGTGNQYFPWIHLDDLCRIYHLAIENDNVKGIFNAVSPCHLTQRKLIEEIATRNNKNLVLPNIPAFAVKIIFGELAQYLLNGSRISCDKLINAGFEFNYPEIENAIKNFE